MGRKRKMKKNKVETEEEAKNGAASASPRASIVLSRHDHRD